MLFRLPEVDTIEDVNDIFGEPNVGLVTRCDGGERGPGVPKYLVEPAEFYPEDLESVDEVQLIDLGEGTESQTLCIMYFKLTISLAFFIECCPSKYQTALVFQPPELVFGLPITKAVDIWNLGCAVKQANRFQFPD